MRVTKELEERKEEILNTAMRLFYEKGYEKTSMADIAKAMNVAQGLCYRYFSSKEVLFDAAIDQYAQLLVHRMAAILNGTEITLKQLVDKMPTFLEIEADESFAYKLCHGVGSQKIHQQLSMSVCTKMVPIVQAQLELANHRGEVHIQDTGTVASFLVFGQLGILLDFQISGEERIQRIKAFLTELLKHLS